MQNKKYDSHTLYIFVAVRVVFMVVFWSQMCPQLFNKVIMMENLVKVWRDVEF